MERIFIVGYMGVGKTTVGKGLAKLLGLTFIDLDKYIENKFRQTIPELFREKGEDGFRKIEQQMLREVADFENIVLSTGGGTPCFFDNMDVMNNAGTTVYISATPQELAARLSASKNERPLITGKSYDELIEFISKHLSEREYYYKKAHIEYYTDHLISKKQVHLTIEGIAKKIKNR